MWGKSGWKGTEKLETRMDEDRWEMNDVAKLVKFAVDEECVRYTCYIALNCMLFVSVAKCWVWPIAHW